MERKRCFISVDLNEKTKEEIKKIQENLPEFKGKKTEIENLHLTLKFLGEINEKEEELTRKALRSLDFKKFKIKINKIGAFSENTRNHRFLDASKSQKKNQGLSGFVRIVWLGVDEKEEESKKLWGLQEEVDRILGDLFEKERRFMGHLTIARVKKVEDRKKFLDGLEKADLGGGIEVEVEKIKLKESILGEEGPEYSDLEVYDLS